MNEMDPTQRFTSRSQNYARYRPGYPPEVLETLRQECGLRVESAVADIGSGTGILSALFLANGNRVYAVEPNAAMREEAERALGHYDGFISVNGRAEATTLEAASVNLVAAGQAFHWFDAAASREEFGRILRPGGFVALVWNARAYRDDPLMAGYERVLAKYGMGYNVVTHRAHAGDMDTLFANGREERLFRHARPLDFAALWGGFLSSSYAPLPGDPAHDAMHDELRQLFDAHQRDGQVRFLYETRLFFGRL